MASYLDGLTERDLATLAAATAVEPADLVVDLRTRPWSIHDLLADENVLEAVLDRHAHPAAVVSPFLLFSVLVHTAAGELREATYVNDWSGPRSRLPVFDVAPLREFLEDPGRMFFLAALLDSFAVPAPVPVPADPLDLSSLVGWLDAVMPGDRVALLRHLGDLALFLTGVFPDRTGSTPLRPVDAERLGRSVGMSSEEMLALCDAASIAPGLDALEALGSRWYETAAAEDEPAGATVGPIVRDVAGRFRAARRVLNHVADRYLYPLDLGWNVAA